MHFLGVFKLIFCYLGPWLLGIFIIPMALTAACFGNYYLMYFLVIYYSYRYVRPAKYWRPYRKFANSSKTPYFNSSKIVFDKGASAPKPNSKAMLAAAPHGILSQGWGILVVSDEFGDSAMRYLIADSLMMVPFMCDLSSYVGARGCSKENMIGLMERGRNVALLPGGFEEASLYKRDRHKVYIKKRKGFIKYALQYGYTVQPAYSFGEEKTYWEMNVASTSWRLWLNKYKIPGTMFIGKFLFLPDNNVDITVVVGKAMELPHITKPSAEDVDKYHALYMKTLQDLFDKYKAKYAVDPECKLEMY